MKSCFYLNHLRTISTPHICITRGWWEELDTILARWYIQHRNNHQIRWPTHPISTVINTLDVGGYEKDNRNNFKISGGIYIPARSENVTYNNFNALGALNSWHISIFTQSSLSAGGLMGGWYGEAKLSTKSGYLCMHVLCIQHTYAYCILVWSLCYTWDAPSVYFEICSRNMNQTIPVHKAMWVGIFVAHED